MAHHQVCWVILEAQDLLSKAVPGSAEGVQKSFAAFSSKERKREERGADGFQSWTQLPELWVMLVDQPDGEIPWSIKHALKIVMKNWLILFKDANAGKGLHKSFFLCLELDDKDLPWDVNEWAWEEKSTPYRISSSEHIFTAKFPRNSQLHKKLRVAADLCLEDEVHIVSKLSEVHRNLYGESLGKDYLRATCTAKHQSRKGHGKHEKCRILSPP